MTGNSNDKVNFTHKFLLTNRQVSSLCKAFAKYLSANITIPKTQLSKIIQSGGFIGRLPGPLMAINFSYRVHIVSINSSRGSRGRNP